MPLLTTSCLRRSQSFDAAHHHSPRQRMSSDSACFFPCETAEQSQIGEGAAPDKAERRRGSRKKGFRRSKSRVTRIRAIVTTNFDRALHDACATTSGEAAIEFGVDDDSLRAALFEDEFFVARIHGRAEVPGSLVLSKVQFDQVACRASYLAFLEHLFTRRDVLFVGFSFFDPAMLP